MLDLEKILMKLRQYESLLAEKYGVCRLGVFGSVARGEASAFSDVDILVELSRPLGLEFVDLAEEIEALLETPVDLVPRDAIKPSLWPFIEEDLKYV